MDMPRPSEAHQRLEQLAGSWLGDETMHPSPWDPHGGPAVGRVNNRMVLDGFALCHEYEQERNGQVNFKGHGVISWDAMRNAYVLHWWDSIGMPVNVYQGSFENGMLVLASQSAHGHSRVSWDLRQPGRYRFLMEVSPNGQQWFPAMEGDYARRT